MASFGFVGELGLLDSINELDLTRATDSDDFSISEVWAEYRRDTDLVVFCLVVLDQGS